MRMVRARVNPGFIAVPNAAEDANLSNQALGLLTRWLRTPHGEEIPPIADMVASRKRRGLTRIEGRDSNYKASYQLEAEGFLVRRLEPCDGGHEWVAYVYAEPVPVEERSNPEERGRPDSKRSRKRAAKAVENSTPVRKPESQVSGVTCDDVEPRIPENQASRIPENQGPEVRLPLLDTSLQTCTTSVGGEGAGSSGLGVDAADAAGDEQGYDAGAAIERDMLAARARAAEKERADAAEAERARNQPNRLPQVEYVGPGNGVNGSAWAPAGGVEPVKVPEQPAAPKQKRYDKPEKIPFPERFHLNSVMAQRAKAEYPHLHPDTEFAEFAAHAREHGRMSANWMQAWHRWLARSERMRRERAERGSFQPRGGAQRPAPRMPDGTPLTYPDGSPLVGTDLKVARHLAMGARLRAEDEARAAAGLPEVDPFAWGRSGPAELPPGLSE